MEDHVANDLLSSNLHPRLECYRAEKQDSHQANWIAGG